MIHTAPDIFKFKYVESDTQQIASDENSKLPEIQFSGRPLLGLRSDLRGRFVLGGWAKTLVPGGGIGRRDAAAWLTEDRVANVASGAPGISAPCRSQAIRSTAGCRSGRRGANEPVRPVLLHGRHVLVSKHERKKRRKQWCFFLHFQNQKYLILNFFWFLKKKRLFFFFFFYTKDI